MDHFYQFTKPSPGDFRQCLPVIPGATRAQICAASISNASFWTHVEVMRLTVNMRLLSVTPQMTAAAQSGANQFAEWLLQVGEGTNMIVDSEEDSVVQLPQGSYSVSSS